MNELHGPWIRVVERGEASPELMDAVMGQGSLYPEEYKTSVESLAEFDDAGGSIVMSHSLIPKALYHAFSTLGSLLSPDLPLTRKQHEIIAATVSSINDCFY